MILLFQGGNLLQVAVVCTEMCGKGGCSCSAVKQLWYYYYYYYYYY